MKEEFFPLHFNNIQVLRGIASIFVVLMHIEFIGIGAFAVDIFFCISGFMMMFSTRKKDTKNFLRKRLIRVIPLYYLLTFITFFAMKLFPSMFQEISIRPGYLLKSLFFIPFDITGYHAIQPLMRIGWTIYYEIFFYVIFFVSMKLNHKNRGVISSGFIIILMILHPIFKNENLFLEFYSDYILGDFVIGIMAYYVIEYVYSKKNVFLKYPILKYFMYCFIFITFLYLIISSYPYSPLGIPRLLCFGVMSGILVVLFLMSEIFHSMNGIFVFLGNISYSTYLIHYYIVQFFGKIFFDFSNISVMSVFGAILAIFVSIFVAWISNCYIENKLYKYLINYITK